MTYEDFSAQYEAAVAKMLTYKSYEEIGSRVWAERLADLEESNPEHAKRYDDEA